MNICIIGAGVTGLATGRLLSKNHNVTIYEKEEIIGGIAKTDCIKGITYHTVGGHCLNSKNKKVMNFIFNEVLSADKWHLVKRKAKINLDGNFVSYPIEFSIKEIAKFDNVLAFNITKDFLAAEGKEIDNLSDWFVSKFGRTLAEKYFIPYNKKIWNMDLEKMSYSWVEGKLPLPNKKDFFQALIGNSRDSMPHNEFYYPNTNNQHTFVKELGNGLNIENNVEITSIEKLEDGWLVNNIFKFDTVISTLPLNILPKIIKKTPKRIINCAKKLKYNKVTNMLWETDPIDLTWSYYPSEDTIFHRHIHIGNFFNPKTDHTITECIGEYSYKDMLEAGKKYPYLLKPIGFNVSDHAYVVYDQNYKASLSCIKKYLKLIGIHSIGRFGEWKYYNMDNCIEAAMKLSEKLNQHASDK
jgi:protoporphyrinogen oxidase